MFGIDFEEFAREQKAEEPVQKQLTRKERSDKDIERISN